MNTEQKNIQIWQKAVQVAETRYWDRMWWGVNDGWPTQTTYLYMQCRRDRHQIVSCKTRSYVQLETASYCNYTHRDVLQN